MSLSTADFHVSADAKLIFLLCFFWPFIAAPLLSRRGRSAGPVAAVLVPLAIAAVGAWLGLARVMEAVPIGGGGPKAIAAGIAEALARLYAGGLFAAMVIVVATIRRHRPIVDRMTAILVTALLADVIGALAAAAMVSNRAVPFPILIAGAVVAGIITLAAITWTFLAGRGRVSPGELPHGVAVVAITIVVMGVIVWELSHGYIAYAMGVR